MIDLLSTLLFAIPLLLAYFVGRQSSELPTLPSLAIMVLLSLFPLAHWHLLRLLRNIFLNLDFKTEAFAASLTGFLMQIEIPLCALIFLSARMITRRKSNRS